jgi:DNA-directed RNA polymerase II subunit RPB2
MEDSNIWKIIDSYFRDNPQCLVRHHTESYDDFFKNGIYQIFKENEPIRISSRFDEELDDYRSQCVMYLGGKDGSKIYFGKPVIYDEGRSHYMFPNEARLRNMTYSMTIHYDVDVEFIRILENDESPKIVGGNGNMDDMEEEEIAQKAGSITEELNKLGENNVHGNETHLMKPQEDISEMIKDEMKGGGPKKTSMEKIMKTIGKKQVVIPANFTTKDYANMREETEKSVQGEPNNRVQIHTITLPKIFLGRFPIMVQSKFCVLNGVPRNIRFNMGECKNDLGGYFIIDGKEKIIVPQEKFADNILSVAKSTNDTYLYTAEIRSVSENVSKPIRKLFVHIVAPTKKYSFKNIVVAIPNVRKPVPLFILFRALGIISDKDIIRHCLLDIDKYESFLDYFIPSVHDAGIIMTQPAALKYIATLTKGKTIAHSLEILSDYFLPHIGETNYIQKAYYLGYMVFRLLKVYMGLDNETNRDNFKFKRIETAGELIKELFREYYTIQRKQIQLAFESRLEFKKIEYENNLEGLIHEHHRDIFKERSLEIGFRKAFKGNWGAKPNTKRVGIVQDLNRLSHSTMISHLRKTNLQLDAGLKLVGPRVLHNTQWGYFDPIDTPDGGNIGLHKHLSISTYITKGISREPMIKWLREKLKMKLVEELLPEVLSKMTKVIVNGLWAGSVYDPIKSIENIKLYRRNALIPIYVSASFDVRDNTIIIYTDAGRVCRPIFYKNEETNAMSFQSEHIMKKIKEGDFTWNELVTGFNEKKIENFNPNDMAMYELNELYNGVSEETNPAKLKKCIENKGIIDFIDTNESETAMIALNQDVLQNDKLTKYTHLEISESFVFGVMCNLINFPENNPATRNSFSCGQSKQAASMYHTNYQCRMDKSSIVLNNGQVPLVKSRYMEYVNNNENVYGENAIVAIMCYSGYNMEDSILVNEGALKRGLFRTTYYSTYESHEEKTKTGDVISEKIFGNIQELTNVVGTKPGYDYSKLDKHGIVLENTEINDKTVLIGMSSYVSNNEKRVDMSKTTKKGQLGLVDKVFITDNEEGQRIAKVRIREERIPAIGDKMASRAGQKGTVGLVIPECDMPFTKDGLRPDLIINPHAIPSRMTIGQFVECIVGKAVAIAGGFGDCTAFNSKGTKLSIFGEILPKAGFHSSGNEILYNGMTGEQIESEIFIGPTYYMRLKHMVKDKINYRASGPRTNLTRQPVSGRANDGGLRIGEMERDSVISHGATEFLRESLMERSDKYYIAICNKTGLIAIYNPDKNLFMSPMADGPLKYVGSLSGKDMHVENITKYGRSFSVVKVPYTFKLLIQELQTINIQMRIITEDNIKQFDNLSFSDNFVKLTYGVDISMNTIIRRINDKIVNVKKIKLSPLDKKEAEEDEEEIQNLENPENESMSYNTYNASAEPNSPRYAYDHYDDSPYFAPSPANSSMSYVPLGDENSPPYIPPEPNNSPPREPLKDNNSPPYIEESKFNEGDVVNYRGGGPNKYKIKKMTQNFATLDSIDPNTAPSEMVKIVKISDLYDAPAHNPYMPEFQFQPQEMNPQLQYPAQSSPYTTTPNITLSPVIKIVNGDDKSTNIKDEGAPSNEMSQTSNGVPSNSFPINILKSEDSDSTKIQKSQNNNNDSEPIDFSKILIKKV